MKLLLLLLPIIGFAQVLRLPNQTTATRASCPSPYGCIAFNSETKLFEGQNGTSWTSLGSGEGTTTIVEDILTSTSATNALSANQGRVLDGKITPLQTNSHTHANKILLDSLTATGTSTEFLAGDGTYRVPVDTNTVTVVENILTSTSTVNALSANQGRILDGKITPLTTTSHTHANKPTLDVIKNSGTATEFLAGDGTYKIPVDTNDVTTVFDVLTSTSPTSALSANQGRVLDSKITPLTTASHSHTNKTLLDSLISNGAATQFLAADGTYKVPVDTNSITIVEDNITSTSVVNALSANQGKVLNEKILAIPIPASPTMVEDVLTSTSATNALSANQGSVLKGLIDTNASAIATNTTNISTLQTASHSHANKSTLDVIKSDGVATEFLAGDGTYKVPVDTASSTTIPTCTGSQRLTGNGTTLSCVDNNFTNLGTIGAGGTANCNVATNHICYYTAGGNHTVVFSGTPVIGMIFQMIVTSAGAYTITWPTMKWPGAGVLNATKANAHSVYTIVYTPGGYLVTGAEDLR